MKIHWIDLVWVTNEYCSIYSTVENAFISRIHTVWGNTMFQIETEDINDTKVNVTVPLIHLLKLMERYP